MVSIKFKTDVWECECCGAVYDQTATINLNGETVLLEHDGHFGYGNWDGEPTSALLYALGLLGYHMEYHLHNNGEYSTFKDISEEKKPTKPIILTVVTDNPLFLLDLDSGYFYYKEDHCESTPPVKEFTLTIDGVVHIVDVSSLVDSPEKIRYYEYNWDEFIKDQAWEFLKSYFEITLIYPKVE